MKEIADAGMLNDYMTKNQIENLFETKQLPFRLCEYDRGEILNNIRDSGSCLQFVVAGEVQIYAVRRVTWNSAGRTIFRFSWKPCGRYIV